MRVLPVMLLLLIAGCVDGGVDPAGPGADEGGAGAPQDDGDGDGAGGTSDHGDATDDTTSGNGSDDATGDTTSGNGSDDTPDDNGTQGGGAADPPETRLLEASVFDLRSEIGPLTSRLDVEVRTPEKNWSADVPVGGSDGPERLGRYDVGVRHDDGFVVEVEGSNCSLHLRVTQAMEDESFDDITQIEVYDDEIWVYGPALPGHTDYDHAAVCGW